jgi:hypothetical protein
VTQCSTFSAVGERRPALDEAIDQGLKAGYLHELVAAKRAQPSDDVLGHLVADTELAGVSFSLLAAGHDTPARPEPRCRTWSWPTS